MQIKRGFFEKTVSSTSSPINMGPPSKVRSHCAEYMQIEGFFCYPHHYVLLTIMNEPKFYLRECEPRKNSGFRGLSLRTEGAFGNAVFEGLHTPRSALRLFHNHGILFRLAKKSLKNLHMCKICCTFVR